VVAAYWRRTRGAAADEMQWEGPPFIATHHAEQCGPIEGGDGSVRRQSDRVGVRSQAQRHSGNGCSDGELDRGAHLGVHVAQ
jgi:hypothetical protein